MWSSISVSSIVIFLTLFPNAFCLKFRGGDLIRVIIVVKVKVEALIVEDMFKETGQDIMTVAIKIRYLREL